MFFVGVGDNAGLVTGKGRRTRHFAAELNESVEDLVDAAFVKIESGDCHRRCSDECC